MFILGTLTGAVQWLDFTLSLQEERRDMKKVLVFCVLLTFGVGLDGASVWAIDVRWMQEGVRVWYFGSGGGGMSSDTEEAYLFDSINGNTAQLTYHTGTNHWSSPAAATVPGSILDQGPFWIHPQALQTIAVGDAWQGIEIKTMNRATYTYATFKSNDEFDSLPYLLLPIKALFDLQNQREIVKLVYGNPNYPDFDPVAGTAYFDAETGLCLFNLRVTDFNTVWFLLSEINYNFATRRAFAEDNGPHTGFKSTVLKTKSTIQFVQMLSSVESRYGDTVQMWTATQAGGATSSYFGRDENYCFFGAVPVLRHKSMSATPDYPPENWNAYGEYLWWWVPPAALADSTINIFNVSMSRTSTAPYTFEVTGSQGGLYFSKIIFDNDGYMTDFIAKDTSIGLNLDLGTVIDEDTTVDGLDYYKATMGRATPATPIMDFNGDGRAELGIYHNGVWYVDMDGSNAWNGTPTDWLYYFGGGLAGAVPVIGNWTGMGTAKVGVYHNGGWYLDLNGNGAWDGTPTDGLYYFGGGLTGAVPVTGDWTGSGATKIGIYADGIWYLDLNGNGAWDGTPTDGLYYFGGGLAGAIPVTGDWTGSGTMKIGVFYNGIWYLDFNGNGTWDGTPTDGIYFFGGGLTGAVPVTGDWTGTGTTKIGVYVDGTWYLDLSGNGAWDGTPTDGLYDFGGGLTGAVPVTGK